MSRPRKPTNTRSAPKGNVRQVKGKDGKTYLRDGNRNVGSVAATSPAATTTVLAPLPPRVKRGTLTLEQQRARGTANAYRILAILDGAA